MGFFVLVSSIFPFVNCYPGIEPVAALPLCPKWSLNFLLTAWIAQWTWGHSKCRWCNFSLDITLCIMYCISLKYCCFKVHFPISSHCFTWSESSVSIPRCGAKTNTKHYLVKPSIASQPVCQGLPPVPEDRGIVPFFSHTSLPTLLLGWVMLGSAVGGLIDGVPSFGRLISGPAKWLSSATYQP